MEMTDEQFNTLAQYEQYFKTALECNYSRYPGRVAVDTMFNIHRAITGSRLNLNRSCSVCVLNLIKSVAKLYNQEKARRIAVQLEAQRIAEEMMAKKEEEPKPDKAKKTTRKKKTTE